jgi:hypothetical protein
MSLLSTEATPSTAEVTALACCTRESVGTLPISVTTPFFARTVMSTITIPDLESARRTRFASSRSEAAVAEDVSAPDLELTPVEEETLDAELSGLEDCATAGAVAQHTYATMSNDPNLIDFIVINLLRAL